MKDSTIIHPAWLRITHWINAVAVLIMIVSGWRIYNADPFFGFRFPNELTLGGAGWPAACSGTSRQCGCWY